MNEYLEKWIVFMPEGIEQGKQMIRHYLSIGFAGLTLLMVISGVVTGDFLEGLSLAAFWFVLFLLVVPKSKRYR